MVHIDSRLMSIVWNSVAFSIGASLFYKALEPRPPNRWREVAPPIPSGGYQRC
ncbi:hypothetical protein TRIATDRAFT_297654 [Trichoderma atroviride IMI 206040]|uniref:Uncharacterized protein n=1 Tax=Hypocrea atroviridis (strain ATCC 20476 / IMI 206040) TaxID=452589 RepID=G9NJ08_HYPAI|nr:uncharacterized protein TRIATDRAFT_297654 [Trichoderma atroviride IMI 206040]EHK48885.1 hypothetical protein TRIATDRAFT_297654 [Trichoderma atroviride IMI 206040]